MLSLIEFLSVGAQTKHPKLSYKDSLIIDYLDIYVDQLAEPEYVLYPTENNWNFLKLNTRTGRICMVQYGINNSGGRIQIVNIHLEKL